MVSNSIHKYKDNDQRVSGDTHFDKYHDDLLDQVRSLQRALAQERGENTRFREEVRALLRSAF